MEFNWFVFWLLISSVCFLAPIIEGIVRYIKRLLSNKKEDLYGKSNWLIWYTIGLFISIWILRYIVGYYRIQLPETDPSASELTVLEEFFNSFVHTLQTFSMDEDYTAYITDGKAMMASAGLSLWYALLASVQNMIAPVVGGAILLEILSGVFPTIRLLLNYVLGFWRPKYYFSKLNEETAAMICNLLEDCSLTVVKKLFQRPIIIIADTYIDDENEKSSELYNEVKKLGAICLRTDLVHLPKPIIRIGKLEYYLTDLSDTVNLQTLSKLVSGQSRKYLRKARIYLFVQYDIFGQIEERITKILEKDNFPKEDMPAIIPVRIYKNLASNLLVDIPLYEPIVGKNHACLNVTILGSGIIGTELFLAVYWCGQMLDCRLNINVISQESEEEFWDKIDSINPEIRRTTWKEDEILRCRRNGQSDKSPFNDPYCTVKYTAADVKNGAFMLQPDNSTLQDTHYFMVALGSDEDNILTAEKIRRYMGRKHVEEAAKNQGTSNRTVIAYVVYDSVLCDTLNEKKKFNSVTPEAADIYMHAFGNLRQVYSRENLFMSEHSMRARLVDNAYNCAQDREKLAASHQKRTDSTPDGHNDYQYWANIARVIHLKYKIFSIGWMTESVFDSETEDKHKEDETGLINLFWQMAADKLPPGKETDKIPGTDVTYFARYKDMRNLLAWLEHRRWNAFTRIMGFRQTGCWEAYEKLLVGADKKKSHKHMSLRLHPCLVECDDDGMREVVGAQKESDDWDCLDEVTWRLVKSGYTTGDYKEYDYPEYEFEPYYTLEKAAEKLGCTKEEVEDLFTAGELGSSPSWSEDVLISTTSIKKYIEKKQEQDASKQRKKHKNRRASKQKKGEDSEHVHTETD